MESNYLNDNIKYRSEYNKSMYRMQTIPDRIINILLSPNITNRKYPNEIKNNSDSIKYQE